MVACAYLSLDVHFALAGLQIIRTRNDCKARRLPVQPGIHSRQTSCFSASLSYLVWRSCESFVIDASALLAQDAIVTVVDAKHVIQHLDDVKPEGVENEVPHLRLEQPCSQTEPACMHVLRFPPARDTSLCVMYACMRMWRHTRQRLPSPLPHSNASCLFLKMLLLLNLFCSSFNDADHLLIVNDRTALPLAPSMCAFNGTGRLVSSNPQT